MDLGQGVVDRVCEHRVRADLDEGAVLCACRRDGLFAGLSRAQVEADAARRLTEVGYAVDYTVVRRPDLSEPVDGEPGARVALIAARLGRTRLIDNLEF